MRVLVVCHLAFPHVGGVETVVDLEIRALAAAGHAVTLVTSDGDGKGRTPDYPPTVRVVRVPAWHYPERKAGVPYPIFGPRLCPVLWTEVGRADVVHAHGFLFQNSVLAVQFAKARGVPSILTDHGGIQQFASKPVTAVARLAAETVGRVTARTADRVVTFNARIQADLARLARRADIEFLPNPIDTDLFRPAKPGERDAAREKLGWPKSRKVVLYTGRLIRTKGVALLAEAADPDAYDLVFCGPGDVSLLGPLPRPGMTYLPPRPQAELVPMYHAADALALPADVREGFPLVVQEAVACGLPVVLGYDPGFEPYRALPNLIFTDRTVPAVKAAVLDALSRDRTAGTDFFVPLAEWVRRLYSPTRRAA